MYNGTLMVYWVVHNEYNLGTKCLVFKKASLFQSDLHNLVKCIAMHRKIG